MRRFFAVLMIIALGVGLYFYTGNKMAEKKQNKPLTEYEKIMAYDLNKNYPITVDEVMTINNKIIKYLYGKQDENVNFNEQIKSLVIQQRKLFDEELLKINPLDIQLEKIRNDIENYKKMNIVIIDSKMLSPKYLEKKDEHGREICKVKVLFYTNSKKDIYVEYGLRKTYNKWKIVGWENTKKFIVAED